MATQADTLTLAATIVDHFSQPLRDMTRRLREFGDMGTGIHKTGIRYAKDHSHAFQDLRKSVKETSEHVKGILTPAMVGLGLGAIGTGAAIAAVTKSIKDFGETARELTFLRKETNLSIQTLREFDALAPQIGSSAAQINQGFESFAFGMEQWRLKLGPMREFFFTQWKMPGIRQLGEEIQHLGNSQALLRVLDFIKGMSEQGKRTFLTGLGLDPNLARATKEDIKEITGDIGVLTDAQVKGGLAAEHSWLRLSNTLQGLKDQIGASLSPAIKEMSDSLRVFIKEHAEEFKRILLDIAAAIKNFDWGGWGTSIKNAAIQVNAIVQSLGGWKTVLAGLVLIKFASWLAPIVTALAAMAGAASPILALLAALGVAGGVAYGMNKIVPKISRPEDLYKPGAGGLTSHQKALRGPYGGLYGPAALGGIDITGRGEESAFKATLKGTTMGAKEGVLQAFQQFDRDHGVGSGGIIQTAYHPGEGGGAAGAGGSLGGTGGVGSPTDDGSAPMGRAQGFGGVLAAHAGQRAILGGHVREAAKAIREGIAGGGGQEPSGAGGGGSPALTPGGADYKGSYHKPGGPGDKRAGLSDRYVEAMRVAENELSKQGVSKEHLRAAAAIMVGNASAESELIPSTVHDQGTGYGIYGARDPAHGSPKELRRTNLLTWLKNNGYAKDSLIGQTRQMVIDAKKRGGAAWEALKGATAGNIGTAGHTYEHYFEAPGRDNNRNAQISSAWRAHRDAIATQPAREGLSADIRQRAHAAHDVNAMHHRAHLSIDFRGMPRGTKTAMKSDGSIFREVRIDRGRAAPMADTGGTTER